MFKLNWINESSLSNPAKERICEKIKQLIVDQGIIIEYIHHNFVPVDTQPIQDQQQVQNGQTSNAAGFKRKYLFSNIQSNPKHQKKSS